MNWDQLLSLKRYGDTNKRLRKEQDENRLGFEVDYKDFRGKKKNNIAIFPNF